MKNILVLIVLFASFPAWSQDSRRLAETYIPKFREITQAIYAGGNPQRLVSDDSGLAALVAVGIKSSISLQGGDMDDSWAGWFASYTEPGEYPEVIAREKNYLQENGVEFIHVPLRSHKPKTDQEDRGIRLALEKMNQATPQSPVYIHCEHGKDRTGLLVALFRVLYQGWSVEDAYAEWTQIGHRGVGTYFTYYLDEYFFALTGASLQSGKTCRNALQ
jgi:hypothetical protein